MGVVIFIFGLIIGSFINVCIYRLPRREPIVFPPSHCTACGHQLQSLELVPVLSYFYLHGKCRYCGAKISMQYPLVELLTGVLFVLVYIGYGWEESLPYYLWLTALLVIVIFIDLDHHLILNKVTYPGMVTGLIYNAIFRVQTLQDVCFGLLIGGGFFLIIALLSHGGMGGGDVKLAAMLGIFLGWQDVLLSFFFAFGLAALVSIILIIKKIKTRKDYIPFGPFMALGALIVMLAKNPILDWYIRLWM